MPSLKDIVEKNNTNAGKIFDLTIQGLIILSLITFAISTSPDASEISIRTLRIIEIITVFIFTLEYLLRIYVADNKLKYIFSFYGLIDLLAILPFYLTTGLDLRSLRAFRLLRLFSLFKLGRYLKALHRFKIAMMMAMEEIILFFIMTLILLFISAVGIYYCENAVQPEVYSSIFESLWWAVTTITTVGYGDMVPITLGGRIFTFVVLMIGLGIIAIPTGIIASALTKAREMESNNEKPSDDESEEDL